MGAHVRVSGIQNLPQKGPYLIVANYQHDLDTALIISNLPGYIAVTTGHTFFSFPLSLLTKTAGYLPLDHKRLDILKQDMQHIAEGIKKGRPFSIFINQHPSKTAEIGKCKNGAAMLALSTKVPVIPMAISGSYKLGKRHIGSRLYGEPLVDIQLNLGSPLNFSPLSNDHISRIEVTAKLKDAIAKLMQL